MALKAIIFDVDGTLANTERDGHRVAFNQAFAELGVDWHWDEKLYGELLAVTGGKERIQYYVEHYGAIAPKGDLQEVAARLHQAKTTHYVALLQRSKIPLRTGVLRLLQEAREKNLRLAIATTTTPANVEALLVNQLGAESMGWFEVIGAGDIVAKKKPAADIYQYVLDALELSADACIAMEDSHNGLVSAQGAGLTTVVTTNNYTADEDFTGAGLVLDHLGSADLPFTVQAGDAHGHTQLNVALLEAVLAG